MTWKKMLWLIFFMMLAVMMVVYFIVSRRDIPGRDERVMGVRSIFPAGIYAPVTDAKNGWQGYGFAGNFRFFSRSALNAQEDFKELAAKNFSRLPLRTELSLFEGGVYALQKAGKGYRLFCLFYKGGVNYWADMVSPDSMHFGRRAFERFILNLEIAGERPAAAVAGQIDALHGKISPFFMQTPGQLLRMMAVIFALTLLISVVANRYSGSCPRRTDLPVDICTPFATLKISGCGRRRITACCLCREGEFLVVYRFRRPFMKIDIRRERQNITWGKTSFRYKNIRIILAYENFQYWQSILLG